MTKMTVLLAAAASVMGGVLFSAASASAAETMRIPAAECYGKGLAKTTERGALVNQDLVRSTTVFCAIVRDDDSVRPSAIKVHVIDNSSGLLSDNFECKVTAVNKFGSAKGTGAERKTNGTNSAGETLTLPLPNVGSEGSTYIVSCKIPRLTLLDAASRFGSIEVIEPATP